MWLERFGLTTSIDSDLMVILLVTSICKCWLNIDTYLKDVTEIAKCLNDVDKIVIQRFASML